MNESVAVETGRKIGFTCLQRNGVAQYRGAVCRAGFQEFVFGFAADDTGRQEYMGYGRPRSPREIFGDLDFRKRFNFGASAITIMNYVAAPFHRFGQREIDGEMWWGWWDVRGQGTGDREQEEKAVAV